VFWHVVDNQGAVGRAALVNCTLQAAPHLHRSHSVNGKHGVWQHVKTWPWTAANHREFFASAPARAPVSVCRGV